MSDYPEWPVSIDQAIRILVDLVPLDEQRRIAALPKDELIELHFGLGAWIRKFFGLWKQNEGLLTATGKRHPDDASEVIIGVFWERLRSEDPKPH